MDVEMLLYLTWGGRVVEMGNASRKYEGGTTKPLWIPKEIDMNELRVRVEECMGHPLRGRTIWFSMKYDRGVILPLDGPADLVHLKKGNDDHGFIYVGREGKLRNDWSEDRDGSDEGNLNVREQLDAHQSAACRSDNGAHLDLDGGDREDVDGELERFEANLQRRYGYDVSTGCGEQEKVVPCSGSLLEAEDYKRRMMIWKGEINGVGQIFPDGESFRIAIFKYAVANHFEYRFKKNCLERISVVCMAESCQFRLSACGGKGKVGMIVNEFIPEHTHSIGEECMMGGWSQRRMRSKLLGSLIESKVKVYPSYTPGQIMKEIELELNIPLTYKQCWRAKEHARMLIAGTPDDHYKLLPWLCACVCRSNPESRAFCDLDGVRFRRMFVAYGASLKGFINGCRKILFVDGCHLTADFGGTLLGAVALDANNNLFDVAYAVVDSECKEEWTWFMKNLYECLGGLKPVIMSDRENGLLAAVAEIFGSEYQSYCAKHLKENFFTRASSLGIHSQESRDKLKNSFNRILYAKTNEEYAIALDAMRSCNRELANWVVESKPEHWAVAKFPFQRWGIVDNNPVESWNHAMLTFRSQPISSLLIGHHLRVGANFDEKRADVATWRNGVGKRVEKKLVDRNKSVGCVVQMRMYDRDTGDYSVNLSNGSWLRVRLADKSCSCRAWQQEGIPCCHALAVIKRSRRNVYDYVDPYLKDVAQRCVYAHKINPLETHDSAYLDPRTGMVVGGEMLDNEFNRGILPPVNGRPRGRPKRKRIESQRQGNNGGSTRKCSRCGEGGHYRNKCPNARVASDLRPGFQRWF